MYIHTYTTAAAVGIKEIFQKFASQRRRTKKNAIDVRVARMEGNK